MSRNTPIAFACVMWKEVSNSEILSIFDSKNGYWRLPCISLADIEQTGMGAGPKQAFVRILDALIGIAIADGQVKRHKLPRNRHRKRANDQRHLEREIHLYEIRVLMEQFLDRHSGGVTEWKFISREAVRSMSDFLESDQELLFGAGILKRIREPN